MILGLTQYPYNKRNKLWIKSLKPLKKVDYRRY